MNKENILISFSGGRTSAFLCKYMIENHSDKNLIFVFANTGKEREETLEFVDKCDKYFNLNLVWIEADINKQHGIGPKFKLVNFETASRNGEPFEEIIKKFGIPNKAFPFCTRELKTVPIKKYLKSLGLNNTKMAIGIRADETHRINFETAKKQNLIYPLATEFRVDKDYIRRFWQSMPFDLHLKDYEGNCDMCWKKSERKLLTLILEKPKLIKWWNEMELKYGNEEYFFYRKHKSANDLIELSNKPFRKAQDNIPKNNLFTDLDIEFDCFCKST
jgi:hypothetical protein